MLEAEPGRSTTAPARFQISGENRIALIQRSQPCRSNLLIIEACVMLAILMAAAVLSPTPPPMSH